MPTPDSQSGVLWTVASVYRDLSGSRDVRALCALAAGLRRVGTRLREAGDRLDVAATRWSLYRDHGYTLRTTQRKASDRA